MSRPHPMAHDTLSRSVTRPHDSRDVTDAGQMLPSQATAPSVSWAVIGQYRSRDLNTGL